MFPPSFFWLVFLASSILRVHLIQNFPLNPLQLVPSKGRNASLSRRRGVFSSSSFSSGDFSVMTCVGKTEAIHKAFYKPLLKNTLPSYLPAPTLLPHFHLLQLLYPTLLLKKKKKKKALLLVFPEASWHFSTE